MSVLLVDVGNTRIKWAHQDALDQPNAVLRGVVEWRSLGVQSATESILGELRSHAHEPIADVRIASVSAGSHALVLAAGFKQQLRCPVGLARVTPCVAGVHCGYFDVTKLGVDRWLAVVAAHQLFPQGAIVIDAGSAVTVDVLDDGRHLGGYIVPGIRLMIDALFRDTAGVRVEWRAPQQLGFGQSTHEAVNHGIFQALLGMIERVQRLHPALPVLLTGGDAAFLRDWLPDETAQRSLYRADLVMQGLLYVDMEYLPMNSEHSV